MNGEHPHVYKIVAIADIANDCVYILDVKVLSCVHMNDQEYSRSKTWVREQKKCLDCESNTGPSDLQSDALPTELSRHASLHLLTLYQTTFISCFAHENTILE